MVAKCRFLEEIGARLTATKIHVFEFGIKYLNFGATHTNFLAMRLNFGAKYSNFGATMSKS